MYIIILLLYNELKFISSYNICIFKCSTAKIFLKKVPAQHPDFKNKILFFFNIYYIIIIIFDYFSLQWYIAQYI